MAILAHKFDCGCSLEVDISYVPGGYLFCNGGSLTECQQHGASAELVSGLQSQIATLQADQERLKKDVAEVLERLRLERAARFALEDAGVGG